MNIKDVVQDYIESNGDDAWMKLDSHKSKIKSEYISELRDRKPDKNAEQSWRSASGSFLEIFVESYLSARVESSDVVVSRESDTPSEVKDSIELQFDGECVIPDSDIIIHNNLDATAIISCKSSIRERVSQTLFWKMSVDDQIEDVEFYFVTTDSDDELSEGRKWRPIVSDVMDGVYVFETGEKIDGQIRPFPELVEELK